MEKQAEMELEMNQTLVVGYSNTSALNLKPPVKRGGTKKAKAVFRA